MKAGWERVGLVGQGAFAKVYLVREKGGEGMLACKIAETAEGMAILKREAGLQKRIEHPLFARYADFVQERDKALLYMEYIAGENLADRLEREGALSQPRVVQIVGELAEGLRYLHTLSRPVLYRDLKPENIRIQPDGRVRLLDLGCACCADEAAYSRAGSLGYAAPEQLRERTDGGTVPGTYSDVYALGRLTYYMLTGHNPCQTPFHSPPITAYRAGVSPLLARLTEQCMEEEAVKRPPDMREVLRQLEPFLSHKKKALWFREKAALAGWFLAGRTWKGDFFYEKCVSIPGNRG